MVSMIVAEEGREIGLPAGGYPALLAVRLNLAEALRGE